LVRPEVRLFLVLRCSLVCLVHLWVQQCPGYQRSRFCRQVRLVLEAQHFLEGRGYQLRQELRLYRDIQLRLFLLKKNSVME
jgi:hypothetical protein